MSKAIKTPLLKIACSKAQHCKRYAPILYDEQHQKSASTWGAHCNRGVCLEMVLRKVELHCQRDDGHYSEPAVSIRECALDRTFFSSDSWKDWTPWSIDQLTLKPSNGLKICDISLFVTSKAMPSTYKVGTASWGSCSIGGWKFCGIGWGRVWGCCLGCICIWPGPTLPLCIRKFSRKIFYA